MAGKIRSQSCMAEKGERLMLRALVLRKNIDDLQEQLAGMTDTDLLKNEEEVRKALEELTPESTEEERSAVTAMSDKADAARKEYTDKRAMIEEKIRAAQDELKSLEKDQTPKPQSGQTQVSQPRQSPPSPRSAISSSVIVSSARILGSRRSNMVLFAYITQPGKPQTTRFRLSIFR